MNYQIKGTMVSSQLANRFSGDFFCNHDHIQLLTATGQHIAVRGEKQVEMKLGERTFQHKVIVADIVPYCILGLDFMRKHQCEIDVNQGILKCRTEEIFMERGVSGKVYCLQKMVLPPRSETIVPVRLLQASGQNRCVLIEKSDNDLPWIMARTLVRTTDNSAVRILNPSNKEHHIKKGILRRSSLDEKMPGIVQWQ
ncbi:Uncharacterized protein OBRU01_11159 [Operophtera brumata]|uniref:Uncharacterized protein n=1 Tax=Operophtera brumata TaxID=104452 RepID=A0A0L7LCN0_OPEBR|nr:Uncharacterized protein OBRU01_11159 [Operophtera brumata]